MAKNSEVYMTAQERAEAFREFCEKAQVDCAKCPANDGCEYKYSAEGALNWLDLEAEEEQPLPCPFCGKTCTAISPTTPIGIMSKVSCNYCSYTSMSYNTTSEAIAAHNRVAKAVNESEAKK